MSLASSGQGVMAVSGECIGDIDIIVFFCSRFGPHRLCQMNQPNQ